MTVYQRVVFNRGTGLGNRLFPWSRCVVSSEESGEPMIAPRWWWPLRKGALFAGGIDRRAYLRQGLLVGVFQPRANEVTGLKARAAILSGRTKDFVGENEQFREVAGKSDVVRTAFRDSTQPRWRKLADDWSGAVVGINVRRGKDFKDAEKPEDFLQKGVLRTPLSWFVDALRLARRIAGRSLPAVVVSDGTPDDLAALLNEREVRLLRPGCPASDILVLSQTRLLLGSGGSSFSAWASYMGQVPIVTIPGQSLSWFNLHHAVSYVATLDPAEPDADFIRVCDSL